MKTFGQHINIGVIGCGTRLRSVVTRLLSDDDRLRLAGVYDPEPLSIDAARQVLGDDWRTYASWEALIADPAIDWVMIGSWNRYHAQQAIAALDAGKHVFCEKPLATTLEDCLAVRDAVRRARGCFAFGLVLRYSPHYQRVRAALDAGDLGELISFEFNETLSPGHGGYIFGNWRRRQANAGSHILEKCCHDLDLANWMTASVPIRVASFGGRRYFTPDNADLTQRFGRDADGRSLFQQWADPHHVDPFDGEADILDHQVVILEYANGVRATFHTNAIAVLPERRFYLLGTHGSLIADAYTGRITMKPIGHGTQSQDLSTTASGGHGGGDGVMTAHLARTMLDGTPPLAGIDEALRSAFVAFAIDEAQSTGRVVDLRPYWAMLDADVEPPSSAAVSHRLVAAR